MVCKGVLVGGVLMCVDATTERGEIKRVRVRGTRRVYAYYVFGFLKVLSVLVL